MLDELLREHLPALLGSAGAFLICLTAVGRWLMSENQKLREQIHAQDRKSTEDSIVALHDMIDSLRLELRTLRKEITHLTHAVVRMGGFTETPGTDP